MRNLFALLLAAMMILASVSAIAENGPLSPKLISIEPNPPFAEAEIGTVGTQYKDAIQAAIDNGAPVLDVFKPETKDALIEAVGENAEIHEFFGLQVAGWTEEDGEQYLILEFATEYKAGEKVAAVMALVKGEEEPVEYVLNAEVPEDYKVQVYFPVSMLNELLEADECFVVIVNAQ